MNWTHPFGHAVIKRAKQHMHPIPSFHTGAESTDQASLTHHYTLYNTM